MRQEELGRQGELIALALTALKRPSCIAINVNPPWRRSLELNGALPSVPAPMLAFASRGTRTPQAAAPRKPMWHRENLRARINVTRRKLNVYQASRGIERAQAQG
jgi:hypothetical protein